MASRRVWVGVVLLLDRESLGEPEIVVRVPEDRDSVQKWLERHVPDDTPDEAEGKSAFLKEAIVRD